MNAVGGYFGLELNEGKEYHQNAIRLNTGRNALEYILTAKEYQKIYLPFFTCEVILEPIKKLRIEYEFYGIDEMLEPVFNFSVLKENEAFLYTNYFGLKDEYIESLKIKEKNIIIDNAQAFFSEPMELFDTFYSTRKFFGVPDGSYLYTNKSLNMDFEKDISYKRSDHLLKSIDLTAEDGYSSFKANDESLSNNPIRNMSFLTRALLANINYQQIGVRRIENFNYLDNELKSINKIQLSFKGKSIPMVYPFYSTDSTLRQKLITSKIYTAQYWTSVLDYVPVDSIEADYTNHLIHLPIDQRINPSDLDYIIKLIKS